MTNQKISTIDQEQGQNISVAGGKYRIIVSGEQTDGNYAVIDMIVPPNSGPSPHSHSNIQEMFYVVDGEVEFKMEGGTYIAKKGSLINIPFGGQVHCFKNNSDKEAHLLCTVIPAGLDNFFKEIGTPIEAGTILPTTHLTVEEIEIIKAKAEKYGIKLYSPDFLGQ